MLAFLPTEQTWVWQAADSLVGAMALAYLAMVAVLIVRRVYARRRVRGERRQRARIEQLLDQLDPLTRTQDLTLLRRDVERLGELARPVAAELLLARLQAAGRSERARLLLALGEVGAHDVMERGLRRALPWRRALAADMLGRCGARHAVPALVERLDDRHLVVRDAAVLALGAIGDPRAGPALAALNRESDGRVSGGALFEAILGLPREHATQIFVDGLRAPEVRARARACHGLAIVAEPSNARMLLNGALADAAADVRAAAAEALGSVGGGGVPAELAAATRDAAPSVRRVAVRSLAAFDGPRAVELAVQALADPDRETTVRAGESLVQLAPQVARARAEWQVQRALVLAEVRAA